MMAEARGTPSRGDRALVTVVPYTTRTRASSFEVASDVPFLKRGAFDAQNLVTVPLAKLEHRIGTLPAAAFADIDRAAVRIWLGWA